MALSAIFVVAFASWVWTVPLRLLLVALVGVSWANLFDQKTERSCPA